MDILITGSVAYDYLMTFPGYFREHILADQLERLSLSFLVESMERLRGGVAPNIAYTLALLGERPAIFATVGEDFEEYRAWLDARGVDTTWAQVVPGVYSASFFANTDRSNAQIASFYPGAMGHAGELSLRALGPRRPDLVVISPNAPQAMNLYPQECRELGLRFVYDPSQQIVRMNADELRQGMQGAWALFANDYEFSLIQKTTGMSAAEIVDQTCLTVITRGEHGAEIYADGAVYHTPAALTEAVVDPTGVGDAFRGGFLTGWARGLSWETCGRMGALAATYCLEQRGPQGHAYTPQDFAARYQTTFGEPIGA
jgi:adenosine kinase